MARYIPAAQMSKAAPKKNKYNARKVVTADGLVFDSEMEFQRWLTLGMMKRTGLIRDLERQIPYRLEVNGVLIGTYTLDHKYFDVTTDTWIYEDVKGAVSRDFPLRKKLMKALHDIDVTIWPPRPRRKRPKRQRK